MGRGQGRRRRHHLLYIACILAVFQLSAGCAQLTRNLQITTSLAKARDSMDAGDFRTALRENEKALRQPFPASTGRVLFQRGLIYSHYGNPERDENVAKAYFQKVIDQYPSSDLAAAAEILMMLNDRTLNTAEEMKSMNATIVRMELMLDGQQRSLRRFSEELEKRRTDIAGLTSAIGRMKLTLKEQQDIIDQYQWELTARQEHIDKLNIQIEDLKGKIEDFKKIDLNIEKKKLDTKSQ